MKTRREIVDILHRARPELAREYGIRRLALFGSYARGDATESSDVDVLVEVAPSLGLRLTVAGAVEEGFVRRPAGGGPAGSTRPRRTRRVDRRPTTGNAEANAMVRIPGSACACLAWLGAVGNANADVLRVGPGRTYTEINPAVLAAADGDVILVEPGIYSDLDVVDKSISLLGTDGEVVVTTASGATIDALGAGKCVVLANLLIEVPDGGASPALLVTDCEGSVRIDDCSAFAPDFGSNCDEVAGIEVRASRDVILTRCAARGEAGADGGFGIPGCDGGDGLRVAGPSNVAVYDSTFSGGAGGDSQPCTFCEGGYGGDGIRVQSSFLFASGGTVTGGVGGDDGGNVGYGLAVALGDATLLDCQASSTSGSVHSLPGIARRLNAASPALEKSLHRLSIRGAPGDRAFLLQAHRPLFEYSEALWRGVLAVDQRYATVRPLGVMSGSLLIANVPLGGLPPGVTNERVYLQVLVRATDGSVTASGPVSLDVLE